MIKSKKVFISMLVLVFLIVGIIPNSFAFNSSSAVTYSDNWATSRNSSNYPSFSSDCTNYLSQVMEAGGISEVKSGSNQWWCDRYLLGFLNSNSWSVADDCKNWILSSNNGTITARWDTDSSTSYPSPPDDSANLIGGKEAIFYDWDSNGDMDHASFCVANGTSTDNTGSGDLINQHTSDRHRTLWHLKKYNGNWATTTITGIIL